LILAEIARATVQSAGLFYTKCKLTARNINQIKHKMFTRINNDTNGNPRFVVHYLQLADSYERALYLGRKLGGRKFHNKQYGGGIAFQSYNTEQLAERIAEIRQNEYLAK
jgi:hypothetical protein